MDSPQESIRRTTVSTKCIIRAETVENSLLGPRNTETSTSNVDRHRKCVKQIGCFAIFPTPVAQSHASVIRVIATHDPASAS